MFKKYKVYFSSVLNTHSKARSFTDLLTLNIYLIERNILPRETFETIGRLAIWQFNIFVTELLDLQTANLGRKSILGPVFGLRIVVSLCTCNLDQSNSCRVMFLNLPRRLMREIYWNYILPYVLVNTIIIVEFM